MQLHRTNPRTQLHRKGSVLSFTHSSLSKLTSNRINHFSFILFFDFVHFRSDHRIPLLHNNKPAIQLVQALLVHLLRKMTTKKAAYANLTFSRMGMVKKRDSTLIYIFIVYLYHIHTHGWTRT